MRAKAVSDTGKASSIEIDSNMIDTPTPLRSFATL